MRVYFTSGDMPQFRNPVVTVGSFDGLHLGHRALLERVRQAAKRIGGESVVVTFLPHPRQVIDHNRKHNQTHEQDEIKLLNTLSEKAYLLRQAGIDNLVVVPFDVSIAGLSADEFVSDVLVRKIGMKHFVVGFDHRFGHDRRGGTTYLDALGRELGFTVEEVARQEAHGNGMDVDSDSKKVSSTLVRRLISAGDMSAAAKLLGHAYIIKGIRKGNEVVVEENAKLLPPAGIYEVEFHPAGDAEQVAMSEDISGDPDCCKNYTSRHTGLLTIDSNGHLYLDEGQPQTAVGDGNEVMIEIKNRDQNSDITGL